MDRANDLLPGFVYGQPPLQDLNATERWQFHLAQLRWLLCSPSLLQPDAGLAYGLRNEVALPSVWHPTPADCAAIHAWLPTLAPHIAHGAALVAAAGAAPLRLGRYAEKLLSLFLREGPLFRLCAEQLAVHEPLGEHRRTVGELDFLLRDLWGRLRHWELAVKFYCFEPPPASQAPTANNFVGPDGADTLERKLSKVFGAQLRRELPAPFRSEALVRQAYSAGYLFYPLASSAPEMALLNPQHARGEWLHYKQLACLPKAQYLALPRWRWLAPAQRLGNEPTLAHSELPERLRRHWQAQARANAVLLAQLDGAGHECARYFIRCHTMADPAAGHGADV